MRLISAVFLFLFSSTIAFGNSNPLINSEWLKENLINKNVFILDIRNKIDKGGIEAFKKGHIPGAVHSDYLNDGWRIKKNNIPGLLPGENSYIKLIQNIGIKNNDHVIIVPAGVSATDFGSAARVYWTLKIYGHEKISILDGGYSDWKKNYSDIIEVGLNTKPKSNYQIKFNDSMIINSSEISQIIKNGEILLIDARTQAQWRGQNKHPAALRSGRIPTGILKWQENNYDVSSNKLKSITELKKIYKDIGDVPVVSYCNTGHWASTNWFVLSELLKKAKVKLYDGSMVDWTNNPNLPVITEIRKIDDIKYWFKSLFKDI